MSITLEELKMFSAIVDSGGFTKAAESLDQAASVLSRRLKRLETKLNTNLLHRTTRSIRLTQEGEWLFVRANDILANIEHVETHFLDDVQAPRGVLRVDAATPYTLHGIVPLISGFKKLFPAVDIILESSESIINLVERKVDVAIRIGPLKSSSLKAKKLGTSYRGLYASPEYIARHGEPRNGLDLLNHCCLGFTRPKQLNVWPVAGENQEPLTVTPAVQADNGETLRQLALQGNGIACLSAFTVRQDVDSGLLIPLLQSKLLKIGIPVYLVYYDDKASNPRVRCFIDYLTAHFEFETKG